MKKVLIGIMVLILCVFTLGCGGNKKPDGVSNEAYEKAIYTIQTTDLCLNGTIDFKEADDKLYKMKIDFDTSLFTDIDYRRSLKKNDEGELIDENAEYPKDVGVYMNIVDLRIQISALDIDGTDDFKQKTKDNIKEIRNKLAKEINYKD